MLQFRLVPMGITLLLVVLQIVTGLTVINANNEVDNAKYKPSWASLDTRPLPEWYDRAKVGIFVHWGVFAVPSFHSEWFWIEWKNKAPDVVKFMEKNYPPGFTYQDFAAQFTAEFFNATEWADLFAKSGAKYVVITSKHHEGYTMFPSKRTFSWNSMDVGPRRDVIGELAEAVRNENLKFGIYHSLFEWFNPMYLEDKSNLFTTRVFPTSKVWPDILQLIKDYKPSVLWSDGDWEAFDPYWNSTGLLAWLYNDSPVKDEIVVNDRWGIGIPCHHGDFFNCNDRYNPGALQKHKWENAFTIDKQSWGYRRNIKLSELMTLNELLYEIVSTVSCGGNVLINVGPTKSGTIVPIFQERLLSVGHWLSINGEAIYGTSPWYHQNDTITTSVWYTCVKEGFDGRNPIAPPTKGDVVKAVYAIFLVWPEDNLLEIRSLGEHLNVSSVTIQMLGSTDFVPWKIEGNSTLIGLPDHARVKSKHAWALKINAK